MRNWLAILLLTPFAAMHLSAGVAVAQPADPISRIMKPFQGLDMDSDGIAEINQLGPLEFDGKVAAEVKPDDDLVLVLVEDRLLQEIPDSPLQVKDLMSRLERFGSDLNKEGYATRFVLCELYAGTEHQDGLTLLAIRRFLQNVDKQLDLKGVVLVGSFPEASIVRRWIWRRENWNVTIDGTAYNGANQQDFLRIVPESVAPRADIVLADLDGEWEEIYFKKPLALESIEALPGEGMAEWPKDKMVFESTKFNDKSTKFEDCFWIQEDKLLRLKSPAGTLRLKIYTDQQHPEISKKDRQLPNPMALPEILVSRINPKHVAVMPDKNFRDRNGLKILDDNGKPQVFETARKVHLPGLLRRDPAFERRLLVDYFDRNHAFRSGGSKDQNRTASVSYGGGLISALQLNDYLKRASPQFSDSIAFDDASLLDFVQFLKIPARLKGISAHSSPWNSVFGSETDTIALENRLGDFPWRWKEQPVDGGFRYVPSLADQGGAADAFVYRTIYENKLLANSGSSLFIHNGCEVNTPEGALQFPFNHDRYGSATGFQNAESILFLLNGVALASRAKTFYDTPRGFTEKMGEGAGNCFGEGWRAYFEVESQDAGLAENVAGNKRAYPWSIIGDWTLLPTK